MPLIYVPMMDCAYAAFLACIFLSRGCSGSEDHAMPLKYKATGNAPQTIALYEAWFGHPSHISIGYSSHDSAVINDQIHKAKGMGISAFVVDWYGDREPFIDRSYELMQTLAAKNDFQVAMMYDETNQEDGATDEALADFTMFHDTYLASKAAGHQAYLTYQGRPLIFIFPKGGHTDWKRVRAMVEKWNPAPLLIQENLPGPDADAFDGFYAWVSPAQGGDGSNWGEQYLSGFYQTMRAKYPDKIIIGGEWSSFDDSKASWGLNRRIAARCGQTFADTTALWHKYFSAEDLLPFVMIDTWNDHEEGTAIEDGIPSCNSSAQTQTAAPGSGAKPVQSKTP
jgi:hypothetical protein